MLQKPDQGKKKKKPKQEQEYGTDWGTSLPRAEPQEPSCMLW